MAMRMRSAQVLTCNLDHLQCPENRVDWKQLHSFQFTLSSGLADGGRYREYVGQSQSSSAKPKTESEFA